MIAGQPVGATDDPTRQEYLAVTDTYGDDVEDVEREEALASYKGTAIMPGYTVGWTLSGLDGVGERHPKVTVECHLRG